ncbi:MAG: glycosyltransferase family 4 protein [Candidatus Staskawiczbacteria bacterium]|jgi:glycosyltransferase involved in cell wall biosynthesis
MIKRKIKICYVTSVDLTLKFILLNHLKFLKNEGYDVYTVCSPGKLLKDVMAEGIKIKTITFKRKFSPMSDIIAFLKLYFFFKQEKFDIVHTHTLKPEFLGQIAAKLAGVPIIINSLHGFNFAEDTPKIKKKIFTLIEKIAARYSSLIFSISRKIVKSVVNEKVCKREKIKYLGDGISVFRFDPSKFSKEFILNKKKELGIDPGKKVIGIVARLVAEKGYLDLFQALKTVLVKHPETLLLVIGQEEPEKRDNIDSKIVKNYQIENNVLFLGERNDVEELYPLMDIFAFPTHREGLGVALLEASAMMIPVIATNTGGCPEVVDDGKTGILIPLKNVEKLTEAILYLFNNPEKAKKMGQNGRQKILREFDERLVFSILGKEYRRLIDEKLKVF